MKNQPNIQTPISQENGGLGADVSGLSGIIKLNGGSAFEAVPNADYYAPGGDDIPVPDGGTGASDAAGARANLGLSIGSDVQAHNALLDDIAGMSVSPGDLLYVDSSNNIVRLPKGSDSQVLSLTGGYPAWTANNSDASFAQLYDTYAYGNSGVNGVTFESYYNLGSAISVNSDAGSGLYESLQANVDGYYLVGFNVLWDYSGTWNFSWATPTMSLRKNNADHAALPVVRWKNTNHSSVPTDTHETYSGSSLIYLESGSYITLYSYPYWGEGMHTHGQMWMKLLKAD